MKYIFTLVLAMLAYTGFSQEPVVGSPNYTYDIPPAKLRNITYNMGASFITANDSSGKKGIRRGVNYGIRYQGGKEFKKGATILVGLDLQYNLSIPINTFNQRVEWTYLGVPVSFDYETFNRHSGYFVKATISSGVAKQSHYNMHTYCEVDGGALLAVDLCRIGIGPYLQYTDNVRTVFDATNIGLRISLNLR